jgi:aspartate/methionine/tyrosine aminotransferase
MGRNGVLKFWFGESDEVTPAFIRDAATASPAAGRVFYTHNLGLPELREAPATAAAVHGRDHRSAWSGSRSRRAVSAR